MPRQPTRLRFGRDVIEVAPKERPVIAVTAISPPSDDGTPAPAPTTAQRQGLSPGGLDAAAGTLATFLAAPRWAEFTDPLMPTAGLPVVADFEASLEPARRGHAPAALPDPSPRVGTSSNSRVPAGPRPSFR